MQNETASQAAEESDKVALRSETSAPSKKPFENPRLTHLGDVRTLTMGASPGTGDSANPAIFQS